jgi:hypothetical protein
MLIPHGMGEEVSVQSASGNVGADLLALTLALPEQPYDIGHWAYICQGFWFTWRFSPQQSPHPGTHRFPK